MPLVFKHLIIGLHIFTKIGSEMTTTLTATHKVWVIHICNDLFNHFRTWHDWEFAYDLVLPGLIDVDVCMQMF